MQHKDNYLLLLFHMGTSDIGRSSLRSVMWDCRALGAAGKDWGVQELFLPNGRGLKGPAESGKPADGYRSGAIARGSPA